MTKKKQNKEEEYLNNWKRAQADLENFRKDAAKAMEEFAKYANRTLAGEILEVLDDLETASLYAKDEVKEGLEQVIKRFHGILEKFDIRKIKVEVGDKLDPVLHEAVEGTGEVIEKIIRAGYKMYERVLRPVRVKVK